MLQNHIELFLEHHQSLQRIWKLAAKSEIQLNSWKIGKHALEFNNNAFNIATDIEINLFHKNECVYIDIQLFIDNLVLLQKQFEIYIDVAQNHLSVPQFTFIISPIILDLQRIRCRSSVFLNIGAWLNENLPKSNDLLWIGSEHEISPRTKKMLRGIKKVPVDVHGYPMYDGFYRFCKVFGFAPVIVNNNDTVLPNEFQRLMKTIYKLKLMTLDNIKQYKTKHNQWNSQLKTWIHLFETGMENMKKYHQHTAMI